MAQQTETSTPGSETNSPEPKVRRMTMAELRKEGRPVTISARGVHLWKSDEGEVSPEELGRRVLSSMLPPPRPPKTEAESLATAQRLDALPEE